VFRWKRCLERINTQSLWKALAEALSPREQEGDDELIALLDVLRKDRGVDGFSVDEEVDIAKQLAVSLRCRVRMSVGTRFCAASTLLSYLLQGDIPEEGQGDKTLDTLFSFVIEFDRPVDQIKVWAFDLCLARRLR